MTVNFMGDVRLFTTRDINLQNTHVSTALARQTTLDPVLSKNLKCAVNAVSPRVVSVRKSFDTVENAINDLQYSRNSPLVTEWRNIVKVDDPSLSKEILSGLLTQFVRTTREFSCVPENLHCLAQGRLKVRTVHCSL